MEAADFRQRSRMATDDMVLWPFNRPSNHQPRIPHSLYQYECPDMILIRIVQNGHCNPYSVLTREPRPKRIPECSIVSEFVLDCADVLYSCDKKKRWTFRDAFTAKAKNLQDPYRNLHTRLICLTHDSLHLDNLFYCDLFSPEKIDRIHGGVQSVTDITDQGEIKVHTSPTTHAAYKNFQRRTDLLDRGKVVEFINVHFRKPSRNLADTMWRQLKNTDYGWDYGKGRQRAKSDKIRDMLEDIDVRMDVLEDRLDAEYAMLYESEAQICLPIPASCKVYRYKWKPRA